MSSIVFEHRLVHFSVTPQEREDFSIQKTCEVCNKAFHSSQAYQDHLGSQNHARNLAAVDVLGTSASQDNTLIGEINALSLESSDEIDGEMLQETAEKEFISSACLFCPVVSSDMQDSLIHMQRTHGLFIPDQGYLIDTESFLGYLFTIISEFRECLYCSITKSTVEGIQHHMKDKGHCKINFVEGSEWSLFYEHSESESDNEAPNNYVATGHTTNSGTALLDAELHLPSGKILAHRSQARHRRPKSQSRTSSSALTASSLAKSAAASPSTTSRGTNEARTSQQLTIRSSDRLGMIGVPAQQQRALRAVEKMMLKCESRARDTYQAGVQKAANRQKFFKACIRKYSFGWITEC